jgi:hypothetical protein
MWSVCEPSRKGDHQTVEARRGASIQRLLGVIRRAVISLTKPGIDGRGDTNNISVRESDYLQPSFDLLIVDTDLFLERCSPDFRSVHWRLPLARKDSSAV